MSLFQKPSPRGKIEALPAWAREHIAALAQIVDEQQAKLAQGPDGSDTFLEPYDENRPLGARPTVRFRPDPDSPHRTIDVRVAADRDATFPAISVMTDGELVIRARSRNWVLIESVRG